MGDEKVFAIVKSIEFVTKVSPNLATLLEVCDLGLDFAHGICFVSTIFEAGGFTADTANELFRTKPFLRFAVLLGDGLLSLSRALLLGVSGDIDYEPCRPLEFERMDILV
jgi:hypothetical protein